MNEKLVTLRGDVLARINELADQQGWEPEYLLDQLIRSRLGLPSDYDEADFDLILKGHVVE